MRVALNLQKVSTFMSSTNKILKNARETKMHKTTEETRNNAITSCFLAFNPIKIMVD